MSDESQPIAPSLEPSSPLDSSPMLNASPIAKSNQRENSTAVPSGPAETDATQTFSTAPSDDAAPVSNDACGRFQIVRPHAQGGIGEVFVAQDGELRRKVALKRIRDRFIDDEESRLRFLREAEITGHLEHPGIVPIYGLGLDETGRPYYAMRFIEGETLRDAVRRHYASDLPDDVRRIELRKLLRCFLDVCNALDYAHSRGVIHRDLKPANIMLGKHGETLVVDWGLAKSVSQSETTPNGEAGEEPEALSSAEPMQTQLGAAMGTPQFMSPEQAAGRHDQLTAATDIYSLGAILYHIITGRAPIVGESVTERLANVQAGKIEPPRTVHRDAPAPLASICMAALALRPEDRYPSAKALADDVERWLADQRVTTHRETLSERMSRWSRTHRTTVAAAMALAVTTVVGLVLGLIAVRFEQQETDRQRQAADLARIQETEQRKLAEQKQREAESAQTQEAAQRQRADLAREQADRTAYAAHLQAADASWESNHVAAAWDHLRAAPKQFRGWEYDYLVTKFTRDFTKFQAHEFGVRHVEFSADGRRLMTAGGRGEVKIWDFATGREIRSMSCGGTRVSAAALSPDGERAAAVGDDRVVRLWDAATGAELYAFPAGDGTTMTVASLWFTRDGRRLVGTTNKALHILDVETGGKFAKREFPGLNANFGGLSPDGEQVAVRSGRTNVMLWDLKTRKPLGAFPPASADVKFVAYSPDGTQIAAACSDGAIKLWDAASRREVNALHGFDGSAEILAFSPDGKSIAAAGVDATVRVWEIVTGRQTAVLRGLLTRSYSVAFSPDGGKVLSGGTDGNVTIWDVAAGPRSSILGGPSNPIVFCTLSHDGTRIAAVNAARETVIWEAATGNPICKVPKTLSYISRLAFSPDDELLAVAVRDESIRLVDAKTGAEVRRFAGLDETVTSIAFSADGRRLAAGSQINLIKVWDTATGRELLPPLKLAEHPYRVMFNDAGDRLIALSGMVHSTVTVWNALDGSLQTTWKGPASLEHQKVAGGDQFLCQQNRTIRRFDVETGREAKPFEANFPVRCAALSPDGHRGATSMGTGHDLVIWEVATDRVLHRLHGHVANLNCLTFSADGTRLFSGGDDRMVKVWDTVGGQELLTLSDHDVALWRLEVSRDGKRVVGFPQTGAAVIWDASRTAAEVTP